MSVGARFHTVGRKIGTNVSRAVAKKSAVSLQLRHTWLSRNGAIFAAEEQDWPIGRYSGSFSDGEQDDLSDEFRGGFYLMGARAILCLLIRDFKSVLWS